MKVIEEGHLYELDSFEGTNPQQLRFIKKEPLPSNPTELRIVYDGTTNEEVLDVLIDRVHTLHRKFPCEENEFSLLALRNARVWLDMRTRRRKKQKVEGKQLPHISKD
ncbi:MAG: hypothetical protein M0R03_10955 [Novosphingobium sp.]|nr:hypothetical protein [Novosphingobium sp.]